MSAPPAESQGWPRGRRLTVIGLVLLSQVAVIFWLAGRGEPPPPTRKSLPARVILSGDSSPNPFGAGDATIFVRANPRGFSGPAWMISPPLPYDQPKWTDATPPSNDLPVQQLGGALNHFLQTNLAAAAAVELAPKPEPEIPVLAPDDEPANAVSTLSIEGQLAGRPLLRPLKLDSWAATDTVEVLSNSVVQTGVDRDGNVFSAVLMKGCGSKDADASALKLARTARFEPLRRPPGGEQPDAATWGQLVFHWHTLVLAPATNNATLKP